MPRYAPTLKFLQGSASAVGLRWLLVVLLTLPVVSYARTALVIGNSTYASAPLVNPVNDAGDIAAKLRNLGFSVTILTNASRREMRRAVRKYSQELRLTGGVGMFYYAGHGMQIKGINYLIPTDAVMENEFEIPDEAVSANSVLRALEEAGNEMNIVVLDACRDNPFAKSYRSTATRGLARMDAPGGSIIAYATAPGDVASDGDGRNGIYTKHLLANMDKTGMPIEQMFKKVRIGVIDDSSGNQTPWEESSLRTDFYFSPAQIYEVNLPQNTQPQTPVAAVNRSQSAQRKSQPKEETGGFVAFPLAISTDKQQHQVASIAPSATKVEPAITAGAAAARDVNREEVDRLLIKADNAMQDDRLTTPTNDNALFYFRAALKIDPANFDAHDGLQAIGRRYAALAQREINRQNPKRAKIFVSRGLSIAPNSNKLQRLNREANQFPSTQTASAAPAKSVATPAPIPAGVKQPAPQPSEVAAAEPTGNNSDPQKSELLEDVDDLKQSFKQIGSSLKSGLGGLLKFGKGKKTRGSNN